MNEGSYKISKPTKPHAQIRAELAADLAAYLARGGQITNCAQGESGNGKKVVIYGKGANLAKSMDRARKRANEGKL